MATPDAATSCDPGDNVTSTNPEEPLPMDEAQPETTESITKSDNPQTLQILEPETRLIKPDPDDIMDVDSDMPEPHSPIVTCEITTVLHSPSLPHDGEGSVEVSAADPLSLHPGDVPPSSPSDSPSPPQPSPLSPPAPPSPSPSELQEEQQPPPEEKKEQRPLPEEKKEQRPQPEEKKEQRPLPEEKKEQRPPREEKKEQMPSLAEKKEQQPPLSAKKEQQPQEPMEIAETFVTVHGQRPPAPSRSAVKRSDHVLISDSVAWMRPAGESLEAESTLAYSVTTVVAPTGAARRKASGVAPRRVPPESGAAQTARRGTWPRRGSSGVSRVSRVSVGVSSDSVVSAGVSAGSADATSPPLAPPQPLPFDCDACQTRFGDRLALAAHSREHGGSQAEPCRRCGRLLAAPLDRVRHERRHHAVVEKGSAAVELRRRSQANASAIASATPTRLLPQRRGKKPTRCGACGEQFRAAALREHFAPHPRTGFYPCTSCGDAFAQQCQLELHLCSAEAFDANPLDPPPRQRTVAVTVSPASPPESEPEGEPPAEDGDDDDYEDVEEDDGEVNIPPSDLSTRLSSDSGEARAAAKSRRHASGGGGSRGRRSISAGGDGSGGGDDGGDDAAGDDGDGDGEVDGGGDRHSDGGGSSGGDASRHECAHCGRLFASARNLARHARLHSKRAQLSCEVCDRVYSRLDALVRHSVEAHEQTRQFPCPRCRWKFTQQRILEYHMKGHEEGADKPGRRGPGRRPRPYRCKTCKRSFIEQSQLDAHDCRADRAAEPAYVCDICGKRIKTKVWLSRHRLLHDEVRPAKCDTCGQGFIDDKALAKHAKTHTDGRRFLCDICGKGFALKVTLQIHSRTHTGERPYACEACGKRFSTRTQLFHHAKIHSGEKPYVCSVCQRGFRQSHHLKTHMKIHADRPEREAREARNARALEPPVEQMPVVRPAVPAILVQLDTAQSLGRERTVCGGVG